MRNDMNDKERYENNGRMQQSQLEKSKGEKVTSEEEEQDRKHLQSS